MVSTVCLFFRPYIFRKYINHICCGITPDCISFKVFKSSHVFTDLTFNSFHCIFQFSELCVIPSCYCRYSVPGRDTCDINSSCSVMTATRIRTLQTTSYIIFRIRTYFSKSISTPLQLKLSKLQQGIKENKSGI